MVFRTAGNTCSSADSAWLAVHGATAPAGVWGLETNTSPPPPTPRQHYVQVPASPPSTVPSATRAASRRLVHAQLDRAPADGDAGPAPAPSRDLQQYGMCHAAPRLRRALGRIARHARALAAQHRRAVPGDEQCCTARRWNLTYVTRAIRRDWPEAIIYINEAQDLLAYEENFNRLNETFFDGAGAGTADAAADAGADATSGGRPSWTGWASIFTAIPG